MGALVIFSQSSITRPMAIPTISVKSATAALSLAMAQEGKDGDVTVDHYTDASNSHADYYGWRVQANTDELRRWAARWLRAWLGAEGETMEGAWTDSDLERTADVGLWGQTQKVVYARFIRTGRFSSYDIDV